jgi:hypothetical protein
MPVAGNKFKIQNPPVVGSYKMAANALYDPFPPARVQKKRKYNCGLKYMYYNVRCTHV